MALPLYDDNGKTAGLALVSLVANDNGRLTQGALRMVATKGASGAVLQRSETGNTIVVKDLGRLTQSGSTPVTVWCGKPAQNAPLRGC
jgi:hypothetical protein